MAIKVLINGNLSVGHKVSRLAYALRDLAELKRQQANLTLERFEEQRAQCLATIEGLADSAGAALALVCNRDMEMTLRPLEDSSWGVELQIGELEGAPLFELSFAKPFVKVERV